MQALTAYVHRLRGADVNAWSASAQRGKQIYNRLDCSSCHVVAGGGRSAGPELTRIGVARKPEQLRVDLTDPAASLPRSGSVTNFLPIQVVTQDGRTLQGTRLNEDAFSLQMRDEQGQLHSLRKSELKQVDKHFERSSMPAYRLPENELSDLVAYLSSLRGTP
jgi:putative heme-binding domain-containing protein